MDMEDLTETTRLTICTRSCCRCGSSSTTEQHVIDRETGEIVEDHADYHCWTCGHEERIYAGDEM